MTHITILGATGRTGRHVLTKSLEAGLEPTVLVRNPTYLPKDIGSTRVLTGDLIDAAEVAEAVQGSQAVVSAAGPVRGGDPAFLTSAVENVLAAMRTAGVRRLIWLTGAGVVDSRDRRDIMRPLIRTVMKVVAGRVLTESEKSYARLVDSGMDYTVVRAPVLSDNPGGAVLKAGYTPPRPKLVSREDLAAFMLECLVEGRFIGESPMVGVEG